MHYYYYIYIYSRLSLSLSRVQNKNRVNEKTLLRSYDTYILKVNMIWERIHPYLPGAIDIT